MNRRVLIAGVLAATAAFAAYALGLAPIASSEQLDLDELVASLEEEFPDVSHIDTEAVAKLVSERGSDIQIIDVREPEEFSVSHIPGAINIPPDTPDEELIKAVSADRPVVVYCSVGYRSSVLAQRLQAAGRTNVSNYIGSIFAWANAGRPLETSNGQTKLVHPYDRQWGRYLKPEHRSF